MEIVSDLCEDVIAVNVHGSVANPSFLSPTVRLHAANFMLSSTKQHYAVSHSRCAFTASVSCV
jgi:hypothetical protein